MTNNFEVLDINILLQCRLFLLGIGIPLPWQNPILQKGRWKISMSFNMKICENSWIFWQFPEIFPFYTRTFFASFPPETPQLSTRTQTPKPPRTPNFNESHESFTRVVRLNAWELGRRSRSCWEPHRGDRGAIAGQHVVFFGWRKVTCCKLYSTGWVVGFWKDLKYDRCLRKCLFFLVFF